MCWSPRQSIRVLGNACTNFFFLINSSDFGIPGQVSVRIILMPNTKVSIPRSLFFYQFNVAGVSIVWSPDGNTAICGGKVRTS
jgi:hypothetical protein